MVYHVRDIYPVAMWNSIDHPYVCTRVLGCLVQLVRIVGCSVVVVVVVYLTLTDPLRIH